MSLFINKLLICCVLVVLSGTVLSQHLADPEFKGTVDKPAFSKGAPRVMFDEAHYNFDTSTGRYKPFADLLMNDGYRIVINRHPFSKKVLESFKLLVIANALADDVDEPDADKPAFSDDECAVVRDWVRHGGALLLIADAGPFGRSAMNLAKEFGVEMYGHIAEDSANALELLRLRAIVYSREKGQLPEHAITTGRDASEKLNRVVVFEGQAMKAPDNSSALLKLSNSARYIAIPGNEADEASVGSAEGLSQGIALKYGSGRVVVMGTADTLSALLAGPPDNEPIGMNYPGIDNKQLVLNIMHWLSGQLK